MRLTDQSGFTKSYNNKLTRGGSPSLQLQKTMISDSEVLNAIAILKAYAEQVKEERGSLYWDAMKSGNEEFAKAHLKRFQAANYIEQQCPTIMQWYRDSK